MTPESDRSLVVRPRRTAKSILPVLAWLPRYNWGRDLRRDVIAGVTLAALLIPESMGYAGVAGVPAEVGLYAALAAVLLYFFTGGTSILVVGPAAAVAALSASIVSDFGTDEDPVVLTAALAITSGLLLVAAGALRLGWIVNFISRPVLHAFIAGLAISIIIGQLDGLFGTEVEGESAIAKLIDAVASIGDWHWLTVSIGVGAVVALLVLEEYARRLPGALLVVAAGVIMVEVFDLAEHGVAIVGEIPSGLPAVAVPDLSLRTWLELLAGGAALLLVGFSEGYAAASSIADDTGEEVDGDQELLATGTANLAAGLVGGMACSGSLSKSAASQAAGARTQVSNLVAGVMVIATLLFLAPLFEKLPEPILAAVVIVAVLKSADPRRVTRLWSINRLDFAAGVATFVLVLVWETLPAMGVGVLLSLAFLVRRASFPDVEELLPDAHGTYHRVDDATVLGPNPHGVAVMRFEAPLLYANAERFRHATTRLAARPGLTRLVLDAEMLSDLDSTGAEALEAVDETLRDSDVELVLARVHRRARDQIGRSRLGSRFEGRLYDEITDAVAGRRPTHPQT